MSKSCVVICLQNNFQIVGLRIKAGGNEKYFIEKQFAGTYAENNGPGEVLQQAMAELNAQNSSRIIVTEQIKRSGIFEIRMPELNHDELRHAVEYELVKHTPLPLNDIIWSARLVPEPQGNIQEGFIRLRIVFMERDKWTKFISELQVRQIKADIYTNPFMGLDLLGSDLDISLPLIDSQHTFVNDVNGLRHMVYAENLECSEEFKKQLSACFTWKCETSEESQPEDYIASMLVGRYVINGEYDNYEKKLALKLPQSLSPQRNKLLKWFTIINGIATLICLALLFFQKRQEVYRVYVEQKNATNLIQTKILNLQKQNAASKRNEKLYKKVLDAVPSSFNPLSIMASLAQKMPKYIWIRSYNMTSDKVHLSLTSSKDPGNLMSCLRNEKLYNIENLRKSRRYDGTYYLYLMLASPDSTGGRK